MDVWVRSYHPGCWTWSTMERISFNEARYLTGRSALQDSTNRLDGNRKEDQNEEQEDIKNMPGITDHLAFSYSVTALFQRASLSMSESTYLGNATKQVGACKGTEDIERFSVGAAMFSPHPPQCHMLCGEKTGGSTLMKIRLSIKASLITV